MRYPDTADRVWRLRTALAYVASVQASTSHRLAFLFFAASGVAVAAACSSDPASTAIPDGASPAADAATPPPGPPADGAADGAATLHPVTFSYHPSWKGVKTVEVFGAFGKATDWTAPLLTLVDNGSGTFTGTVPALAGGHYSYLFRATGDDAAAAKKDKLAHYAIDPTNSAFVACPAASPTFNAGGASNPCSDLTVPQPAAAPLFHARGVVQSGGVPIAGYLVEIERDEPMSHHMFADRTTTGADGTFDLAIAAGTYRFQVLHPTFYTMTDAQRTSPETLAAVRRSISSAVMFAADRTVNAAEVAYAGYAAMNPRGPSTLPTTFTFGVPDGTKVHAAVYGPGPEIGDPWWTAPFATTTSDDFDGGFNTNKAADGGLKPDASYSWGTEQQYPRPDGGVTWTAQSMVFPIRWQ